LWLASVLTHAGLHEDALAIINEVIEIQPDDILTLLVKGETLGWMGDSEQFLEYMERSISAEPSWPFGHLFRPIPLLYLDREEEAERAILAGKGIVGDDTMLMAGEALLWAKRGEVERASDLLESAIDAQQSVSHAHHTYHYAAAAYATLGQSSRAVEVLDLATQTGMPNYPAFSIDPHFRSLGERADFQSLMQRIKVVWKALRDEFGRV
jgi:tetratricopeptide (TPR) repeat protein